MPNPTPEDLAILSRLYNQLREMKRVEEDAKKILFAPIRAETKQINHKIYQEIGKFKEEIVEEIFKMKYKFRMGNINNLWRDRAKTN